MLSRYPKLIQLNLQPVLSKRVKLTLEHYMNKKASFGKVLSLSKSYKLLNLLSKLSLSLSLSPLSLEI